MLRLVAYANGPPDRVGWFKAASKRVWRDLVEIEQEINIVHAGNACEATTHVGPQTKHGKQY